MDLHANYDNLTDKERKFVDDVFRSKLFDVAKRRGIRLCGDDRAERAVDAFAEWVIESRSIPATS